MITMKMTPGWRLWASLLLTVVIGVLLSVTISIKAADRAVSTQLRQQCDLTGALIAVYRETPPVTLTGKNVQQAYIDQYRILGCPPKK